MEMKWKLNEKKQFKILIFHRNRAGEINEMK